MERVRRTRVPQKPDLILCSDIHLREDTPTCWIGDFQKEQWLALGFIKNLQAEYGCPVVHAGDLFHHWKPSPWLLSKTMSFLPDQFSTIYGQHVLPQHALELREKSGIYCLEEAGRLDVLEGCHYGQEPTERSIAIPITPESIHLGRHAYGLSVLVWHHMTYITPPFPGAIGGQANGLLQKYPQFDLILTGDNHQSFATEHEGRLLVNPGAMTRQTADQMDFKPRVALWYAVTNTIEWVNIPIQEGVISREHIDVKQQRDSRIDAFISRLDGDWVAGMSFEDNLEAFFNKNETRDPVKQIIYTAIG
jgi:DNA repair exonuclease SbcCD nuclease subunit